MNSCWECQDALMEAALGGALSAELEQHLERCAGCAGVLARLRTQCEQMDAGVREVVRGTAPSPALRARVLAAVEAENQTFYPRFLKPLAALGGWMAVLLTAVALTRWMRQPAEPEAPPAQVSYTSLAQWRSPTDGLLRSSVTEFLSSSPRLGEGYEELAPKSLPNEPRQQQKESEK